MRIVGVAAPLRPVLRKLNLKTGPEKSHDIRAVGKKIDRLRQSIRIGGIDQRGGIEPEFKVKRAFARCVESGKLEYDPDLIFAVYDLQKPLCIGVQRHMNAVFVNGDRLRQCAAHDRCFAFEILVNRRAERRNAAEVKRSCIIIKRRHNPCRLLVKRQFGELVNLARIRVAQKTRIVIIVQTYHNLSLFQILQISGNAPLDVVDIDGVIVLDVNRRNPHPA